MKRIILSIWALIYITAICAQSQIFDVNGIYYRLMPDTLSGNGDNLMAVVTTLGNTDHYQGEVSIPSSITHNGNNYDVKAISDMAFKCCKQLTSISIPGSVIQIPAGAFYGCNSLESIKVSPDNDVYDSRDNCNAVMKKATNTLIAGCKNTVTPVTATSIGECAFYGCSGLTSINLPYSIDSIGKWAFLDCTGLLSVAIPESMTSIEDGVFQGCTALTTVEIPSSITSIGECAFYGCNSMTLQLPAIIPTMSDYSIAGIKTLYWNSNNSPKDILEKAQPEALIFGNDVTGIEYTGAFYNCTRLKEITIPASVKTINRRSFDRLYSIETLNWNANVSLDRIRLIENSRYTLKTIVIGDAVTCLDHYLFNYCTNLESISVNPGNPVFDSRDNCNAIIESVDGVFWYESDEDQSATSNRYYSEEYYHLKKDRLVYGSGNAFIPNTVTAITGNAFSGNTILTSIVIPSSVNTIEGNPFSGCIGLNSISVDPDNSVYDSRYGCNAIIHTKNNTLISGCKNTIIPQDVTDIRYYAFSGCSGLTSIDIPSNVISIGSFAFYGCSGLESITIPESITSISWCSFMDCSRLKTVQLHSGIKRIVNSAFSGCYCLTSIDIPSGVTAIEGHVFSGCLSLTSVTIPSSVDTIMSGAFSGCSSLPSINIPAGVSEIWDYAFSNCSSLTSLTLPSGISYIAPHLVEGCSSLQSINIPSKVDSIGEYAFAGCSSLKSIIVPSGVTTIYFNTFYDCNSLSYLSLPSTVNKITRSNEYDYYNWYSYLLDHFEGCDALKTAGPKGGGYNYEFDWDTIPANAFRGLSNLETVYIPRTVKAVYECDYPSGRYDYQQEPDYSGTGIRTSSPQNPSYEAGYISSVFDGCDKLQSVAVSFKETKLMQLWRDLEAPEPNQYDTVTYIYKESPIDFNLYKCNNISSVTILDDSINNLKNILTKGIKEVVVSEYVNYIDSGVFFFTPYDTLVERYYFINPSYNDTYIPRPRSYSMESQLESITVLNGNTHYASVDGVLLNKDCTTLIICPTAHKGGYYIPSSVTKVSDFSFKDCTDLRFIQIPTSVEIVGERAFENCNRLEWVTFEGSPEIGKNAFNKCNNISSVAAHTPTPGLMNLYDVPQTIAVSFNDFIIADDNFIVNRIQNSKLNRYVTEISHQSSTWTYDFVSNYIPAGSYRIGVGVVPNSDELPNKISFQVIANTSDGNVTIYSGRKGSTRISFETGTADYDSVFIPNTLNIPECLSVTVRITTIKGNGITKKVALDQLFFEPIGDEFPEQAYAGPFSEKVFNNATLYVPDGAVGTYQDANGWKLFKNIAIDTSVEPIRLDTDIDITDKMIIYDSMGRKVDAESIEQLSPGLYIINGITFMIR